MLQQSESSKDFLQIPIERSRHGIQVYLKRKEILYKFLSVKQSADGSIECIFHNLNSRQKGISQTLEVEMSPNKHITKTVEETDFAEVHRIDPYVTYHTTGRVNYHGCTFKAQFFEPLDGIEQPQFFFMVSICEMDSLQIIEQSECAKRPGIIIDISAFEEKRCNFLFAVVPKKLPELSSKMNLGFFIIGFQLFGLAIELLDDSMSFNFSSIYDKSDIVKFKPHFGKYLEQKSSINEAYLNYQHKLYETKELIILPPNGEGIVKIIFTVEMRRAPWIYLEFEDKMLCIDKDSIKRTQTNVSFKVKDLKSGQYVKSLERLHIKTLILDAEIYEDESVPPKDIYRGNNIRTNI